MEIIVAGGFTPHVRSVQGQRAHSDAIMCYVPRLGSFGEIEPAGWEAIMRRLRDLLRASSSMEEAAGVLAQVLYSNFASTTALVRVYAVVPYGELDEQGRRFVDGVLGTPPAKPTSPTLPVLALMGTQGNKRQWCDRTSSRGHLGIPLGSAAFVQSIPMVARLLKELGLDLQWLDEAPEVNARRLLGGFNGVFYVDEATTARDSAGRLIIPAQDFVNEQGIRTVFGMGGFYPGNALVAIIVFCKESLNREQVDGFKSLVSTFKGATSGLAINRAFFAPK